MKFPEIEIFREINKKRHLSRPIHKMSTTAGWKVKTHGPLNNGPGSGISDPWHWTFLFGSQMSKEIIENSSFYKTATATIVAKTGHDASFDDVMTMYRDGNFFPDNPSCIVRKTDFGWFVSLREPPTTIYEMFMRGGDLMQINAYIANAFPGAEECMWHFLPVVVWN